MSTMDTTRKNKRKRGPDETTYGGMQEALELHYKMLEGIMDRRQENLEWLERAVEEEEDDNVLLLQQNEQSFAALEDAKRDDINTRELRVEDRVDLIMAFAMLGFDKQHPLGAGAEVGVRDMILRLC